VEKTLEIHLQEERERIAREIKGQLSFYLTGIPGYSKNSDWDLGFAQALAFIAQRVERNFDFQSGRLQQPNR
jgi:hypothetical protein